MSERIHALAQQLFGKSSVDECSLEEIQTVTKNYPYFAPAQFLLLQKLKDSGDPGYAEQRQKAVLYYPDPFLFDFFISQDSFAAEDFTSDQAPEKVAPVSNKEIIHAHSPALSPAEPIHTPTTVLTEPDRTSPEEKETLPEPTILSITPLSEDQQITPENEKPEETRDEPESSAATTDPNTKPLPVTIPTFSITETKDTGFVFEPYHTVDYFASQGIKFSTEEGSKDRLSHQLRSFTDWLKIMKKLPATEMAKSPQSTAEKSVENLASHSVEGSDIVTEAMAEVWAKQGNKVKAIETYNKLSLLNPSKKAYFAAKIENLNGS